MPPVSPEAAGSQQGNPLIAAAQGPGATPMLDQGQLDLLSRRMALTSATIGHLYAKPELVAGDVISALGDLVAKNPEVCPSSWAGQLMLEDPPPAGGDALRAWLAQHSANHEAAAMALAHQQGGP